MHLNLEMINGVSVGIEFLSADEDVPHNAIVIDILIIRIVAAWL